MLDTADAIAISALERENSLGAHIRLDGGVTSVLFGKPYSISIYHNKETNFEVERLSRTSTPWNRVLAYVLRDLKRKVGLKVLRILPVSLQDQILEKRYHSVMGNIETVVSKHETDSVRQEIDQEAA